MSRALFVSVISGCVLSVVITGNSHSKPLLEHKTSRGSVQENVLQDMADFPKKYPLPKSQWQTSQRERFKALLSRNKYDVIVVPFQVVGGAFDRATRSYMATYLAQEIRRRSNSTVADPQLVARALGDGQRRFDPSDVYDLARAVGARTIIWGHTGHSHSKYFMALTFQIQEASAGSIDETTKIEVYRLFPLKLAETTHPAELYASVVPEFLSHLSIDLREPVPAANETDSGSVSLAGNPTRFTSADRNSVQAIYDFHLLASLTPKYADRVRERFVEKSMLALHRLSETVEEHRLLKARSLMLLGSRPAALSALGTPGTIEERYFYEYLNGNLPLASELAGQIRPVQKRFIAELELATMAAHYGVYTPAQVAATIDALGLSGSDWQLLANRALSDSDIWVQFGNLDFKKLLNKWFPIEGPAIESLVKGAMTVGDSDKSRSLVDFSVHNHVISLLTHDPAGFCCAYDPTRPSNLDLLDLVEAMAIGNLARRIELQTVYQGLPERAISESDRLDAVYVGHPLMTLKRAQAEWYAMDKVEGAARLKLQMSAYRNAFDAYYWSQGQTHTAAMALETINYIDTQQYGLLNNPYSTDYPYRPYFVKLHGSDRKWDIHNARAALKNSAFIVDPVIQLKEVFEKDAEGKDNKLDLLLESIEGRFGGNMEVALIKTEADFRKGDRVAAEHGYRTILATKPNQWAPYSGLAVLLIEDGRVTEAARTALSFPGFAADSGAHAVGLSNNAFEIGSRFFWAGYFTEALPFYRISAELNTGSYASITSQVRLDLLERQILGALQGSYQSAVRYGEPDTYRDYLAILYAMGFADEAWNGFNALLQQMRDPAIWEAALVGHRVSATSEAGLIAWARQDVLENKGYKGNLAATYLLRASVTDRLPSEAAVLAISEIDEPVWSVDGRTVRKVPSPPGSQSYFFRVGPAKEDLSANTPDRPVFDDTPKTEVESDLVYFAKGYKALRENAATAALQAFDDASRLYDVSPEGYSYMLPYMAFAAATTGNTDRIQSIISRGKAPGKHFHYLLAKAVLSGLSGKTDEAAQFLLEARHNRRATGAMPVFSEYQFGEIVEWLYEQTGENEFRLIAIEWAQVCQKTKPWHAWSYAMEAKLSNDSPARRRAIAMAHYLDPLSDRLATLPKSVIEAAVSEFARTNPFRFDRNMKEYQTRYQDRQPEGRTEMASEQIVAPH
jgi:hypothetical protein